MPLIKFKTHRNKKMKTKQLATNLFLAGCWSGHLKASLVSVDVPRFLTQQVAAVLRMDERRKVVWTHPPVPSSHKRKLMACTAMKHAKKSCVMHWLNFNNSYTQWQIQGGHGPPIQFGYRLWHPSNEEKTWYTGKHIKLAPPPSRMSGSATAHKNLNISGKYLGSWCVSWKIAGLVLASVKCLDLSSYCGVLAFVVWLWLTVLDT